MKEVDAVGPVGVVVVIREDSQPSSEPACPAIPLEVVGKLVVIDGLSYPLKNALTPHGYPRSLL